MAHPDSDDPSTSPALESHLLGQIGLDDCLALQKRVAEAVGRRDDGQVCLLLCEHPEMITVGRGGSPAQLRRDCGPLRNGQVPVRWVKRGGGCLVHAPGQLAIYPILPLDWHGYTVGEYLERLQGGLLRTFEALGVAVELRPERHGLWGRTGQLASLGVSVRDGVTRQGAFINVSPSRGLFRLIEPDPWDAAPMSTLVAERGRPVKMTSVRAELVGQLTTALGCDRYHLYTGHPWLQRRPAA